MDSKDLKKIEKIIGYEFKDKDLLKEAITHRSYLNENPKWKLPHNERLEFLGDAVLELIVTEILFDKYPDYAEGQLTAYRAALVNYQMMSVVAKGIKLEDFLLLSHGEARDFGKARDIIMANACEALIGAMYLDSNYNQVKKFIEKFLMPRLKEVISNKLYKDAKSLLQEYSQGKLKITPIYKVISEMGPDHKRKFVIGVYFGDKLIARGEGASKQDAEVEAAKRALVEIQD